MNVILIEKSFIVCKVRRGYLLKRCYGDYKQHAHFRNYEGAIRCLDFIKDNELPRNDYFREALKRLLTDEEFSNLREKKAKDRYRNVRRC